MSSSRELGDSASRFREYIDRLIRLMQRHEVRNVRGLIELFRSNHEFSSEWRAIWSDIAEAEGGKISLTTAGTILGAVLGGVGIGAMGGAIALPLALVLGLGGLIAGAEFDSVPLKFRSTRSSSELCPRRSPIPPISTRTNRERLPNQLPRPPRRSAAQPFRGTLR
jgi:hypothetical protein